MVCDVSIVTSLTCRRYGVWHVCGGNGPNFYPHTSLLDRVSQKYEIKEKRNKLEVKLVYYQLNLMEYKSEHFQFD